ncbi:MAG: adenine glycosylase, partial [Eggerthellaceae bacterium]|nr:adenine glycosylase [Eggerthellaceae bacterium]
RAVFIHEFFAQADSVTDKELSVLVRASCCKEDPCGWYYALLDYGAHIKQLHLNPSRKSAHYSKQGTYVGSRRQKRAELLRVVLADPGIEYQRLFDRLNESEAAAGRGEVEAALFDSLVADMLKEGFFREANNRFYP